MHTYAYHNTLHIYQNLQKFIIHTFVISLNGILIIVLHYMGASYKNKLGQQLHYTSHFRWEIQH